jgi:hypothetical protein
MPVWLPLGAFQSGLDWRWCRIKSRRQDRRLSRIVDPLLPWDPNSQLARGRSLRMWLLLLGGSRLLRQSHCLLFCLVPIFHISGARSPLLSFPRILMKRLPIPGSDGRRSARSRVSDLKVVRAWTPSCCLPLRRSTRYISILGPYHLQGLLFFLRSDVAWSRKQIEPLPL